MKKTYNAVILFVFILLFTGCAAHTNLEPLGKSNCDANFSFGGPIVAAFDTHLPVPYFTGGVDYGLTERINLTGTLHGLPLFYSLAGVDFGAAYFPVLNHGWTPAVGLQANLFSLFSFKREVTDRFRAYPILSCSASWQLANGNFYLGTDWTIPLTDPDYDDDAVATIVSPFLGYRWNLSARNRLQFELKIHGLNIPSDQLAVEYTNISGHGALTPFIAWERSFK